MKHIYLVRHGETEANKTRMHQNADESLTVKGRLQAHHVAHMLESKGVDALVSSPYRRARETAMLLGEHFNLPYTLEEGVVEIRRPDHLYGQTYYSKDTLVYFLKLFIDREHPRWDYDGAENIFALRNRIEDVKRKLSLMEEKHIVVITHDMFMNLFIEHVCKENRLSLSEFLRTIMMVRRTPNTGISHITHNQNASKGTCAWSLVETINPSVG